MTRNLNGPNGAQFHTARSSIRRGVPNGAEFHTALRSERNACRRISALSAVWDFAPFGTSRRLGPSAVWDLAPFGTERRLSFFYSLGPSPLDSAARSLSPHGVNGERDGQFWPLIRAHCLLRSTPLPTTTAALIIRSFSYLQ